MPELLNRLRPPDLLGGESTDQAVGEGDCLGRGLCLLLALELGSRGLLKLAGELCQVIIQLLQ